MPIDWTPFVEIVRPRRRFLLTTHVRPDGDGLGSMLALADVLESQGKSARLVVASSLPPRYDFLDPRAASAASSRPATNTATRRPSWCSTPEPGANSAISGLSCAR